MNKKNNKSIAGFSLIELLIVITIIAAIIAAALPNFLGARQRARDSKRKAELAQFKNALRLYYGDYQKYPLPTQVRDYINGCGTNGTDQCPTAGPFQAGGLTGTDTVYMKRLPDEYSYQQTGGGDGFVLRVELDNLSDGDIAISQARCGLPALDPSEYQVCED